MAEIIFDSEYITVVYHPETKIVHHTIHKTVPFPILTAATDAGTEALAHYGASKWLSDDRKNTALSQESLEYALSDWGARTVKAGWKYWALVVPTAFSGRLDMTRLVEHCYNLGVRVMVFTDPEEAYNWLAKL
jgi:hypothetical protein